MEIFYVTNNIDKFKTAQLILGDEVKLKQVSLDILEPQSIEPRKVSEFKTKQAYETLKRPLFVTDAGLSLDAFNGFPGALVKFLNLYVGQDGILRLMKDVKNRSARAIVSLTFYDGKTMKTFEEVTEGIIAEKPYPKGWDYDRLFIPKGFTKTWAEMGFGLKNKDSCYRTTLEKFSKWLKSSKS